MRQFAAVFVHSAESNGFGHPAIQVERTPPAVTRETEHSDGVWGGALLSAAFAFGLILITCFPGPRHFEASQTPGQKRRTRVSRPTHPRNPLPWCCRHISVLLPASPGLAGSVAKQRSESGCASRFGHYPQGLPQRSLSVLNGFVRDQRHALHMPLRDGEHEFFPPASGRASRAAIPPASASTGRPASNARSEWARLGSHSHDFDSLRIPGGDAADQAATPHGHDKTVELGILLFELEADRGLAEQGFELIVGVHD